MNVDRNDDILKEIPFEVDSRVNDSNGNNTCKTSNANIEYITMNGNGKSKNVDIRVEFQFKRCSTGKYCKYEKFQTFRNSNSLVHLSSCNSNVANNNVVIRRSKSSTGISNGSFQVCNLMENFKSSNESKTTLASISVNNEAKSLREDLSQDSSTRVDLVSLNEINLDNEIQVDEPYNNGSGGSGNSGMGESSLFVTPSTLCTIVLDANEMEVIRKVNYIDDNIEMDIKSANDVRPTTTGNGDNGLRIIEKSQSNFSMSKNTNPFLEMDEISNSNHKFNDTEYIENESTAVPIGNVYRNLEKTERSDKILLLNEVEKAISIVRTHDDDSLSLDDDDVCCSELLQNSNRNNFTTNPSHSHKSCTSLFPTNDLDRKTKHRTRKHRSKEFRTSSDNIITSSDVNRGRIYSPKHETNSINDENKKNEKLDKFITEFNRRIIADGGAIKTAVNGSNDYRSYQSHTIIGGIPTCPFKRQDYLKPDDDDTEIDPNNIDANPTKKTKRERKDLFGFSLHRDKCGGKIVPSIRKFNISYPNKTKNSDDISVKDGDKKLFKKSLIKIGQKCGLRLNKSPEKRLFDHKERTTIEENHCDVVANTSASCTTQSSDAHTKAAYKSYKSEIDLTRNLQYLDAFLNENFDKTSQPKGSYSIGKISRRKKYGHKRTKSCSRNMDYDNEFSNFEFDLAENVDTDLIPSSLPKQNEISLFQDEDNLKITFPASTSSSYYYRQRLKQQANVSSSDSFSTYNSKQSKIHTKLTKEIIYSMESTNCDKSGKSNTTSSSLSSDYASVYSPSGSSYQPFIDHRQKTSYDQQQLDSIEKQLQMNATSSSSSSRYEKRSRNNSTDNFLNFDKAFPPSTSLPHSSNHHSIDHFEITQPDIHDKIKYQYENQLPYHEDYLKHYQQLSKSTIGSISNFPSHNPYTNYRNTSSMNGSSYGHHHYQTNATTTGTTTTVVTPTQNQNYSHRVIVSKSRKQRGEVVLEYEC